MWPTFSTICYIFYLYCFSKGVGSKATLAPNLFPPNADDMMGDVLPRHPAVNVHLLHLLLCVLTGVSTHHNRAEIFPTISANSVPTIYFFTCCLFPSPSFTLCSPWGLCHREVTNLNVNDFSTGFSHCYRVFQHLYKDGGPGLSEAHGC